MTVTPEIVNKALKLVFGTKSDYANLYALKSLDRRVLKSAFREKAMHFHPDRAEVLGLDEHVLDELFKRLHGAYRLLNRVLSDEGLLVSTPVHRSTAKPVRPVKPESARNFFHGRAPEKKLKFAQFLYYNGVIDWQSMIDAVTWQLKVRPKIGEIGRAYRFFDRPEVLSIIQGKERAEFFGGAAFRMGMVSRFQLNAMIGKQRSFNYPIGRYFCEKGIFSKDDLETLIVKSRQHNRLYA